MADTPLMPPRPDGDDHAWMGVCLVQARRAAARGEVPVGALVVHRGRVIGRGFNLREAEDDPTAHAEIVALREAARHLGHWRVLDSTLYVTLEPCVMCAGALVNARVTRLVYGCADPKAGAVESLYAVPTDSRLNHRLQVTAGVRSAECAAVLRDFFRARRRRRL
ncbi:MAG: tRNA adenosine(34) deaminase TadA [Myxococcales bacterium]|nr:tRNA adenosine(34) deaminase TadA [Myxococcales bacterium]